MINKKQMFTVKLIPFLLLCSFLLFSCIESSKNTQLILPESDPMLYFEVDSKRFPTDERLQQEIMRNLSGSGQPPIAYDKKGGTPYTGTHSTYYEDPSGLILQRKVVFQNGKGIKAQTIDEQGNEIRRSEIFYEGEIMRGSENYENGILMVRNIEPPFSESGYFESASYYPDGTLKFRMARNELGYQGLMTLYDEQGNVLKQERYKDGKLVETIKE